jgi:hypothetical protein
LRDKINDIKIKNLEIRASKSYKITEIQKKDFNSTEILNFLKDQNKIPLDNIKKIINFTREENYPVAFVMTHLDSNKIVGFMGTLFSKKRSNQNQSIFCNIHSWIVDNNHRLYSFYLILNLIKKKTNLIALTPVFTLKGLLKKLGFEKKKIFERFFLNLLSISFKKNNYNILKTDNKNQYIEISLLNKINNELIVIKGNIVKRKGIKTFKILLVKNLDLFIGDYKEILNLVSKKYKIYIFSEYGMSNNDFYLISSSFFSVKLERHIYTKSIVDINKSDLLNTDLAI